MAFNKLLLASVFIVTLSACSNSSPSKSEIKAAIKSQLPDCSYVSIENFEKVNGRKIDEQTYVVDVKYSVVITPSRDSKSIESEYENTMPKLRENLQIAKDAFIKAHDAQTDDFYNVPEAKLDSQFAALIAAISSGPNANTDEGRSAIDDLQNQHSNQKAMLHNKLAKMADAQLAPFQLAFANADNAVAVANNKRSQILTNFRNECKAPSYISDQIIFGGGGTAALFAKGFSRDMTQTFQMVKTDNGWLLAQ